MTFSLCMIVKDEAAILRRCLDSIADLMDEIIIVDTGSTDNTKAIALEYTDKVYDFTWCYDFSAARNFAFSKAGCDYIYSADADEVLDAENHEQLRLLKECLLPEIEIVQMHYHEIGVQTVQNIEDEYRPKLFKRLRSFTWIDPIHETVRTDPVVFDSDIFINHMPVGNHSRRDFSIFTRAYKKDGRLSDRILAMYAKELYKWASDEDLLDGGEIFAELINKGQLTDDLYPEAFIILSRCARIQSNTADFTELTGLLIKSAPYSEVYFERGEYALENGLIDDANEAFSKCIKATPILDISVIDQAKNKIAQMNL